MADLNLAVIMTCHNRREKTLSSLDRLHEHQDIPEGLTFKVYLTDDGSTDGTAEAVRKAYPDVHILEGDGNLYWNQGMRLAWSEAMEDGHDQYLWLNDDTLLYPDALKRLLNTHQTLSSRDNGKHIIVCSTQDAETKEHTYGGVIRCSRWHPLKFKLVEPSYQEPVLCDTMNGNCVLIPNAVTQSLGNLDSAFTHGIGDFDYGLRALKQAFSVLIAPGFYGTCSRNTTQNKWQDKGLSFKERFNRLNQPKGLPVKEWKVFAKRHAGPLWPLYCVMPYARSLIAYCQNAGR